MPLEKHFRWKLGFIGLLLLLICAAVSRLSAEKVLERQSAGATPSAASMNVRALVDSIYTIPELYDGITLLDGQTVKVFGSYVPTKTANLSRTTAVRSR
jgi:hypothetical protein